MDHSDLDDRALLTLAKDGSAPAFAVLVHRHLPVVDAVLGTRADRDRARVKVFVNAMRRLDQATDPFEVWIDRIAREAIRGPRGSADADDDRAPAARSTAARAVHTSGTRADDPADAPADDDAADVADAAARDRLWRELARRWPNGRRPLRVPSLVTWLATLIMTIGLSAAVPWITLGQFDAKDAIPALRAFPIDSQGSPATPDQTSEEEPEPLPTYEFPTPPSEEDPAPDQSEGEEDGGG